MCFAQAFQRLAQGNSGSHCAKEAMEAASMAKSDQHSAIMFSCRGHCKVRCFCGWGLYARRSNREAECRANVAGKGHRETRGLADVARGTLGKTMYFASDLSEDNEKLIVGRAAACRKHCKMRRLANAGCGKYCETLRHFCACARAA